MKIIDVVCSKGRTGFYFDDQRAIKQGAGHDGVFYTGEAAGIRDDEIMLGGKKYDADRGGRGNAACL